MQAQLAEEIIIALRRLVNRIVGINIVIGKTIKLYIKILTPNMTKEAISSRIEVISSKEEKEAKLREMLNIKPVSINNKDKEHNNIIKMIMMHAINR